MADTPSNSSLDPKYPALLAVAVCVAVALTIFYPMLSGQFLGGDDQLLAGYAFRQFGAEAHRATGSVPQWNPYIFGGIPFFAVIGQGDIFYPTAWLRWFLPTGTGMTIGMFLHVVLAGVAMYALLRGLKLRWGAALTGGVAYELTGMVTGQISPGHDGKLFVAALAPLAFLMLLRAIRHNKIGSFGGFAIVAGLAILTPQVQTAYYLLVASGLFALWLCFFDPDRRRDVAPWKPLGFAAVAALLGVGISMIEILPILSHVQYTPRGAGGTSLGWEYATAFAMPVEEAMTTIYPQFNGMLNSYWGQNFFKSHTEYLGAIVVMLAVFGFAPAKKKGLLLGFGAIGLLFLLVAFGGHTPFYALWYQMPMMKSVRAVGMAFYLVALVTCVFAGLGAERLLAGEVKRTTLWVTLGVFGFIALLGATGMMQGIAEGVARGVAAKQLRPGAGDSILARVIRNEPELREGGMRLLIVMAIGGTLLVLIQRRKVQGIFAALALPVLVAGDNWSVLKHFGKWYPPAPTLYTDDDFTSEMKKSTMPFRVYDPSGAEGPLGQFGLYNASNLMAVHVPQVFGYEGMESKWFDDLLGGKNQWENQMVPNLWDLYAVSHIMVSVPFDSLAKPLNLPVGPPPGFHLVKGPVAFDGRDSIVKRGQAGGFLYQRDSAARWVRIIPAAAKAPEGQIVPTVIDARFPIDHFVLYPDTVKVEATVPGATPPPAPTVRATLADWKPGAMTVKLEGKDTRTTYLLVAENWYPDWKATVDGKAAPTMRADGALLSVAVPPGASEIKLVFDVPQYHTGRMITWLSLAGALGFCLVGWRQARMAHA